MPGILAEGLAGLVRFSAFGALWLLLGGTGAHVGGRGWETECQWGSVGSPGRVWWWKPPGRMPGVSWEHPGAWSCGRNGKAAGDSSPQNAEQPAGQAAEYRLRVSRGQAWLGAPCWAGH